MKGKSQHLVVIVFFALCIPCLEIENLQLKSYGRWGPYVFGGQANAIQSSMVLRLVKNSSVRVAHPVSEEYSYAVELWQCCKAAANTGLPYIIYWYYFWYL